MKFSKYLLAKYYEKHKDIFQKATCAMYQDLFEDEKKESGKMVISNFKISQKIAEMYSRHI